MADLSGQKIVIAGGSGFLGLSMAEYFSQQNATVTILSRSKPQMLPKCSYQSWDGRSLGNWHNVLEGSNALVNLSGRTVNCIKTPDHQDEILRSRIESTQVLGQAMRQLKLPPPVWIQMSTAHIYGDPPSIVCNERVVEGIGFAPSIARAWKSAFLESKLPGQRSVIMRTSFCGGPRSRAPVAAHFHRFASSPSLDSGAKSARELKACRGSMKRICAACSRRRFLIIQ